MPESNLTMNFRTQALVKPLCGLASGFGDVLMIRTSIASKSALMPLYATHCNPALAIHG